MQILKEWAPVITLFITLGGLQTVLYSDLRAQMRVDYNNLRTDLRQLSDQVSDSNQSINQSIAEIRERLARVEAKLDILYSGDRVSLAGTPERNAQ